MLPYEPRIDEATRERALQRVRAGRDRGDFNEEILDAVVAALWPKMLGDCRDRVATALHAARAFAELGDDSPVENIAAKRRGLLRALDALDHPAAWPEGATGPQKGVPTREEIERGRPTRQQLNEWGIAWPPPRGWKKRLLAAADAEANRGE